MSLVKPAKKIESLKEEGKISNEKSFGRLSARRSGKFDQGKLPRLQVQSEHGSLKFQEEGEIIHEAYDFDGMDDEIEDETPEFPEQEKLNNEAVSKFDLYADHEESYENYKAALPVPDFAKNEEEVPSMKEALSWQLQVAEEVPLKHQEVNGAVQANTAVQEDTAIDPEEVRTKKQASANEADTTTKPDAATEVATTDMPEEVRTENQQSEEVIS